MGYAWMLFKNLGDGLVLVSVHPVWRINKMTTLVIAVSTTFKEKYKALIPLSLNDTKALPQPFNSFMFLVTSTHTWV